MKNRHQELLWRRMRQYHRSHRWTLSAQGLYVTTDFSRKDPESLTWWQDFGFVLNNRMIDVTFEHPRYAYSERIKELSREEAGENPGDDWLADGATKIYRHVGASRKRIVAWRSREPSEEQNRYYDRRREIENRLKAEGVDFSVSASFRRERINWAVAVTLIVPMEIRNESDLEPVADLARRLLTGKTTIEAEFPGYIYGKKDWLRDQKALHEPQP